MTASLRLTRTFVTSASRAAAAAPAAAPAARPAVRPAYQRAAPVARPAAVRPAATRVAPAASARRVTPAVPVAPSSDAAAALAAAAAEFSDTDDFPLPAEEIGDYAHLQSRATVKPQPTPSPPLTSLPDANYKPLPTAGASSGGGPPSLGATGPLGSSQIVDGYVFGKLPGEAQTNNDWTTSFLGLSEKPFDKEVAEALLKPLDNADVEIKPDGLLYLPEIKYRRTLNAAFGPGGWGMAPRGETHVGPRIVSREWGLVCLGRLVAIARGEQEYFDPSGIPTATEACKSNALMRCCKDLGVASELWDPRFIREYKAKNCTEAMVEHITQKKKRKLWRKKDAKFDYPYKEIGPIKF